MSTMLDHALDYASRGLPVLPCRPAGQAVKRPYVPRDRDAEGNPIDGTGGVAKATTDPDAIRAWWEKWPSALVGCAMGRELRLLAIDPDVPKEPGDPDGLAAWNEIVARHGGLPATHAHETPSGGRHYVFTMPEGLNLGNKEGALKGKGINVRGDGGYLIMAPSRLADGREYRVADEFDFGRFAPAPQWLLDLIVNEQEPEAAAEPESPRQRSRFGSDPVERYVAAAVDRECDDVARCARGGRNIRLNDAAFALGQFVGAGVLSRSGAERRLWDAASACGHLKDEGRSATLATIASGLNAGEKKPRDMSKVRDRTRQGQDRFAEAEGSDSAKASGDAGDGAAGAKPKDDPFPLIWHGEDDDTPLAEWLVEEMLPKVGTALLSGQWGTYKTFCGFDLSAAVIVGGTFAGRQVKRAGGVLWMAVEGQSEVRKRLAAVAQEKIKPAIDGEVLRLDPDRLPFVWVKACPKLSDPNALPAFKALVEKAAVAMRERFGMDLSLVIIDTLSPAAEMQDANDTAEAQRVMTALKRTAEHVGTVVLAVDHMGKDVSTGTRNSSVKEADVDAVLALLGEKDLNGTVNNPRLAMRKLRGAPTGWEVKFDKRVVTVGTGFNQATTLVVDWASVAEQAKPEKIVKSPWTSNAERIFKGCLERMLIDHGSVQQPFGRNGPKVKAAYLAKVRAEFASTYPGDDDDPRKAAETKSRTFRRTLDSVMKKDLVATKQIGASLVDWIWFAQSDAMAEADEADE